MKKKMRELSDRAVFALRTKGFVVGIVAVSLFLLFSWFLWFCNADVDGGILVFLQLFAAAALLMFVGWFVPSVTWFSSTTRRARYFWHGYFASVPFAVGLLIFAVNPGVFLSWWWLLVVFIAGEALYLLFDGDRPSKGDNWFVFVSLRKLRSFVVALVVPSLFAWLWVLFRPAVFRVAAIIVVGTAICSVAVAVIGSVVIGYVWLNARLKGVAAPLGRVFGWLEGLRKGAKRKK